VKLAKSNGGGNQGEVYGKIREGEYMEKEGMIGKAWGKVFKKNKQLVHVDLSNNQFGE